MYEVLTRVGDQKCGTLGFDIVRNRQGKYVEKRDASFLPERKCALY